MVRVVLLLGVLLGMSPAMAADPGSSDRLERLAESLDEVEARLTRVRGALDQTRFDPDELLFDLAFDAAEVVTFVTSAVAFQPYDGLLRGIRGTLQSRSGNSLDQAVLLAYLLKSAGFEARVVRGTLSRDQVVMLLAGTASGADPTDLSAAARVAQAQFDAPASDVAEPVDMASTATAARAREAASTLAAALSGAGVALPRTALDAALLEALRRYFWVQWRQGAGSEWQDVHPAFSGIPATPEAEEYFADEVPARYHHTVTFSAGLRRRVGSDYEAVQLMEPWTRPAANLHGVALSYHNQVAGLRPGEGRELLTEPRSNRILVPMFNGAAAPGAIGFDLRGRPIDAMVAGQGDRGAGGLFAELGERLDEAAGVVADPDDPGSAFGLEAMWLEWTLTRPDGTRRSQRRYLHGPRGDTNGQEPPAVLPLLTEHTYVVNTGALAADYVADRYLATGIGSTAMFQALAERLLRDAAEPGLPRETVPESFAAYGLFPLMARNPLAPQDVVAVRGEPAIIGVRSGLRDPQTAFTGVDVVFNRVRHVVAGGPQQDTGAALERGVWETALEWLPNRTRGLEDGRRIDVFEVFAAARAQDIPLRVVGPSAEVPDAVSPDPAERVLLERDLADGYLAVVPERRPEGLAQTGWWRVDPDTGAALGMTGDGYGAETIEYVTQLVSIPLTFIGVVSAVSSLAECESSADELQKMCCLVEKHLDNVGGLGFGGVLGATFGGAAATTYGVVDLGLQQATGTLLDEPVTITPDVVNLGCQRLIEDKSWL